MPSNVDDLEDRLSRCFAAVFPSLAPEQIRRASQASLADWDSVAAVSLVSVIEEEFEMELPFEDLEQITSFDLVRDYLASRHGG